MGGSQKVLMSDLRKPTQDFFSQDSSPFFNEKKTKPKVKNFEL